MDSITGGAMAGSTINPDAVLTEMPALPLPSADNRNILITSALPYVNNQPHLGTLIGCVLSADVFSRYCKSRGYNTLYVCGSDEYGTATETKALEEGISERDLCTKYWKLHKQVYEDFRIEFSGGFGRTSTEKHSAITQDIFRKLHDKGLMKQKEMKQLYSLTHKRFLADRYVSGTCPICNYHDARGDQCDNCQQLIVAIDLINPRSKLDGSTPEVRSSEHFFLDLPSLQPRVEALLERIMEKEKWSANAISVTRAWLKEGFKEKCITRDLKWGVPVPHEGFENKVFYVWFDAVLGYLSITANLLPNDWQKWWKNPKQVEFYNFLGKDNVPFHSIIFPAMLLGTEEEWTLVKHISATEYLQYENTKFSKSRGTGVFGSDVMETGIAVDVWRYYLLAIRPETQDSNFGWGEFLLRLNGELIANFANFVNRILSFACAKYSGIVPDYRVDDARDTACATLLTSINEHLKEFIEAMESVRLREGLKAVMDMSGAGNLYLSQERIDDKLFKEQRGRCDNVIGIAVNVIYLLSALAEPFLPDTARAIRTMLGDVPKRRIPGPGEVWRPFDVRKGHKLGRVQKLFEKIPPKLIESKAAEFRARFGGSPGTAARSLSNSDGVPSTETKKKKSKDLFKESQKVIEKKNVALDEHVATLVKAVDEQGQRVREVKQAGGDGLDELLRQYLRLKLDVGGKVWDWLVERGHVSQ